MNETDDSDLTPAAPPPSYAYSLTLPVHRPAGEPPPARPLSPPDPPPLEAPPPGYESSASARLPSQRPAPVETSRDHVGVPTRSPPPVFSVISLPRLLDAAPTGAILGGDDDDDEDEAWPDATEQQRLWDLWSARGVGLGERVVRIRAYQAGVLVHDDEDDAEQLQAASCTTTEFRSESPPTTSMSPTDADNAPSDAGENTAQPISSATDLTQRRESDPLAPTNDTPSAAGPISADTAVDTTPSIPAQLARNVAQVSSSRIPRLVRTPIRVEVSGQPSLAAASFPGAGRSLGSPSSPIVSQPNSVSHRVNQSDARVPMPSARP